MFIGSLPPRESHDASIEVQRLPSSQCSPSRGLFAAKARAARPARIPRLLPLPYRCDCPGRGEDTPCCRRMFLGIERCSRLKA